jgi:hypothetical protein
MQLSAGGPPANGPTGTFAGKAGIGSIYVDNLTGFAYTNTGTKASPVWLLGGVDGGLSIYPVTPSGAATVQLTTNQSGSTMLFDTATGVVYTLPSARVGLTFGFSATVSVTSNTYKVITKNATEFLIGALTGLNTASADAALAFSGNGTTHIAVTQNSTGSNATGGLIGSDIVFQCVSLTQWMVSGTYQSGTTATTPFATS